jgi:hypothetical protein
MIGLHINENVVHFFSVFGLSCYVSLCSEFRVAHFFSVFVLSSYVSLCAELKQTKEMNNTELRT